MSGAAAAAVEPPTRADAEVVERARGGDREAFRILVECHQARAYGLALRVLRDEEQARDVVQEGFLKAYRSLDRFEGRSSFYTWLYRLVMNLCIDQKRRDKSARQVEWQDEQSLSVAPGAIGDPGAAPPAEPIDDLHRAQLRKQLAEAIEALPDDARRTFQLREVDGLAYAEIAKTLGIPKGTVMSRLHYARRRLREALLDAGVVEPEGAR